jgi:hypothetical protein
LSNSPEPSIDGNSKAVNKCLLHIVFS